MFRLEYFNTLLEDLHKISAYVPEVEYLIRLLTKLNKLLKDKLSKSSTNVEDLFLISILDPLYGFISMLKDPKLRKDLHSNFIRDFTGALAVLSCNFLLMSDENSNKNDLIKRIAYLNYAANQIIKTMTDAEEVEQQFYYIIVPDSISDVRVKDISKLSVKQSKFSIMYVSEKLLMGNMEKTVSVACHEISHQVGSIARLREKRYEKITNIIAYLLLYYAISALLEDANNNPHFESVISILAKELSLCWKEQYKISKGEDFYLKTIREFIDATHTFTKMQVRPEKEMSSLDKMICEKWSVAIKEMDFKLHNYICSSLNNYFHTTLFDYSDNDYNNVAQILYNSFSNFCVGISENVEFLDEHTKYCDIVIQAFSESYSDLQMIKYRNINDFSEYSNILRSVSVVTDSVEDTLRINAIKSILSTDKKDEINITFEGAEHRDFIALKNICEYLIKCKDMANGDINILPFEENKWIEKN